MARLRNQTVAPTESQQASKRMTRATRVALKEKTNTARQLQYPGDGDTEALVKDAKPRRGRPPKVVPHNDGDFLMTGAIGGLNAQEPTTSSSAIATSTDPIARGDTATAASVKALTGKRKRGRPRKESVQEDEFDEIVVSTSASDMTTKSLQNNSVTTATTPVLSEGISDVLGHSKENAMAHSALDLSPSSPPEPRHETIATGLQRRNSVAQPGSALRNPETPAFESSMLLKNFKRRPRQPSMLAMVQQHQQALNARTSNVGVDVSNLHMDELEGNDTTFGVIAGLDSDGDVEDFSPEAEGTPLQHTTAKSTLLNSHDTSQLRPYSRTRPSVSTSDKSGALAALRAKRRKSHTKSGRLLKHAHQDIESDVSSQPIASSPPHEINEDHPDSTIQVLRSSPVISAPSSPRHSDPALQRSLSRKNITEMKSVAIPSTDPQNYDYGRHSHATVSTDIDQLGSVDLDDTMAEPISSSPSRAERQTEEDIMAYPLTQPTQQSPRQAKRKKPPKSLGTAALQSLLPKQRRILQSRNRKSEYDLDSSDIAGDDNDPASDAVDLDEEWSGVGSRQRATSRRSRTTKRKIERQMVSPVKSTKGRKDKSVSSLHQKRQASLTKGMTPKTSSHPGRKVGRTYSKVTASNKDNDELYQSSSEAEADGSILPDVTITSVEAAKSKELEDAKSKFAEIDQWDGLEFENLDSEDHRSSSQGWR